MTGSTSRKTDRLHATRGLQTGLDALGVELFEKAPYEPRMHERLSAGHRHAAAGRVVEELVGDDGFEDLVDRHLLCRG